MSLYPLREGHFPPIVLDDVTKAQYIEQAHALVPRLVKMTESTEVGDAVDV